MKYSLSLRLIQERFQIHSWLAYCVTSLGASPRLLSYVLLDDSAKKEGRWTLILFANARRICFMSHTGPARKDSGSSANAGVFRSKNRCPTRLRVHPRVNDAHAMPHGGVHDGSMSRPAVPPTIIGIPIRCNTRFVGSTCVDA